MNKKIFSMIIAAVISTCMLITTSSFPSTVDAIDSQCDVMNSDFFSGFDLPDIIDKAEADANNYNGRVKSEENDLNTFVFANGDGTTTMRIFNHPVKYVADDGTVHDISLNAEAKVDGGFVSADHRIVTTFERKLSDGVNLAYDNVNVTLIPELESVDPIGTLSSDGKVVAYEINDVTSYAYSLTYAGFKEDIIVDEYTGQTEYEFTLYTNGLSVENNYGSYYLVDSEGDVQAMIGDIIVFTADERNNTMGSMTCETICENREYTLTIHLDDTYLSDENTIYPIRIDPSIEVNYNNNGAGAIEDVTINSNTGSDGLSHSLFVGKRQTYGKSRILMKFPGLNMNSLPGSWQISAASVEIRDLMCEGTGMTVNCNVFDGNTWTESTANWTNVNADSYSTFLSSKTISYANGVQQPIEHRYSFNILPAVRGWKNGTYDKNKGIIFRAPVAVENGSTYIWKTLSSFNRISYSPSISVTYRNLSNVASINNSTYSTSQTLNANYAYRFAFTPSVSDKYSFWTESSIDTHISVYENPSYTSYIDYNDDSGHGYNACLTLSLNAGSTYYIFVQGHFESTSGSYTFKIRRGLPMSGYEEPKNFSYFNSSTYQNYTNCYTYALDVWKNPVTGNIFRYRGCDPGELSGNPITQADLIDASTAKTAIVTAVGNDCIAWGGSSNDFYEVDEDEMVPEDYYKVALVLYPGWDYHWYRHVSDLNGKWAHKPGVTPAKELDGSGEYIYAPYDADWGNYTVFLGYFALKPPSAYSTKMDISDSTAELFATTENVRNLYHVKTDITLNDFNTFIAGETTEEEILSVVGASHDVYGSGYIGERYYTADGFDIIVYYCNGIVDQIRCLNADGTYTVL